MMDAVQILDGAIAHVEAQGIIAQSYYEWRGGMAWRGCYIGTVNGIAGLPFSNLASDPRTVDALEALDAAAQEDPRLIKEKVLLSHHPGHAAERLLFAQERQAYQLAPWWLDREHMLRDLALQTLRRAREIAIERADAAAIVLTATPEPVYA